MLTIYCPTHESDMLVGPRRIRRLVNTERGIGLVVECYCGQRVIVATGRRAHRYHQAVLPGRPAEPALSNAQSARTPGHRRAAAASR